MLIALPRKGVPFRVQLRLLTSAVTLLVVLEIINLVSGRALNGLGIYPRVSQSLWTLPFAPLLHADFWHLISNLMSLVLFAILLLQHGLTRFWLVTVGVTLLGGFGVWLFARPAYHLGSSLLIFGYFGYLLLAGVVSREVKLLLISIGIGLLYGSLLWGVLPQQHWVSFEAHLFGFLAGLVCAVLFGRARNAA